ncbi:MAG: hypothetical protein IPF69_12905 [Chitinophagaceae bacterium]|nr:hypothetical protein [Chitinophagaceae bacterium]
MGELQFEVIQYRLLAEYGASFLIHCHFIKLAVDQQRPEEDGGIFRFKQANAAEDKDGNLRTGAE